MAEIKNYHILDSMLKHAAELVDGKSAAVTAERYIVAVIDAVNDEEFEAQIDADECRAIKDLLRGHLPSSDGDVGFEDVRERLMEHIISGKTIMSDMIYMRSQMTRTRELAEAEGHVVFMPSMLLAGIFDHPNSFLKTCFIGDEDNGAETESETKYEEEELSEEEETERGKIDDFISGFVFSEAEQIDVVEQKAKVAELTKKVKQIYNGLRENIFGQDNAISTVAYGCFHAELMALTDKNNTRPRATFLFAGPPGVGKTFLAEKTAEALKLPFMRFDMSEYSDKEATLQFAGSDKVYKNGKEGVVTGFVRRNPKCVLLFDEIEKAHLNVIHLFLQMLDAGRVKDCYEGKEVDFSKAIIILTTNAGRSLYEESEASDFSAITRKVILKAIHADVNPETGKPFFPSAICSRFASGNVTMFNHITAHNLREIAKREVLKCAESFEERIGIKVDIDETVYTALLFAEGGAADARTIRSRAEAFFEKEIFELFRLLDSDKVNSNIEDLESITISVELPENDHDILPLFVNDDSHEVVVFSSKQTAGKCREQCPDVAFTDIQDVEAAKAIFKSREISFCLIDLGYGISKREKNKYLNIEDVDSPARDFFWFVRENYADIPVYLLEHQGEALNAEEMESFVRYGVRGSITLEEAPLTFSLRLASIGDMLHQQKSMLKLAKANKLVAFETAQTIKNKGRNALIKLFDFEMETALDAEDSKSILSNISKPDVRFDQVIGAKDAKKELQYFVEYLKNPKKYMGTGVSAPKGVVLYGPPGTGKTMLAKAMACESDVTFINAEGNQFVKSYVGQGSDKVHELFRTARKYAPSILFIDEIDAIGKERHGQGGDTESTLTAFLAEMDGFSNDTTKPVFVLAATNFDVEPGSAKSLDPALMRRFDRRIFIDLPDREDRIKYLKMRFEENKLFKISDEQLSNIAVRTTGMSLAELASVIELALRSAVRDGGMEVTDEIFDEALETFSFGEEKKWNQATLERVARHESGHAFLCWKNGETPSYLTITARGDHGGYMLHDDNEDKQIITREDMIAKIQTSLGGRAAEIVYYGKKDGISSGAASDLRSATYYARQIICTYGMDEEFGLAVIDREAALHGAVAMKVHDAVNKILSEEMQNAIKIISENKKAIDALVEQLFKSNHLSGDEINRICKDNT